jgi:hypothetical protein
MRAFRILIVFLLLLCLLPPLSLLAATLIARWARCELDQNAPVQCTMFGGDYGGLLYAVEDFGYFAVETIPAFVALLAGWLIVEIVRAMGRRKPQAPAASRKRVRGS